MRIIPILILTMTPAFGEEPAPIIVAEVKVCKWHAPYNPNPIEECEIVELVPHKESVNNLMGCMRAISMGAAQFYAKGSWWMTKGGTCKEQPSDYMVWRKDNANRFTKEQTRE